MSLLLFKNGKCKYMYLCMHLQNEYYIDFVEILGNPFHNVYGSIHLKSNTKDNFQSFSLYFDIFLAIKATLCQLIKPRYKIIVFKQVTKW